jgi:hypothetical protein
MAPESFSTSVLSCRYPNSLAKWLPHVLIHRERKSEALDVRILRTWAQCHCLEMRSAVLLFPRYEPAHSGWGHTAPKSTVLRSSRHGRKLTTQFFLGILSPKAATPAESEHTNRKPRRWWRNRWAPELPVESEHHRDVGSAASWTENTSNLIVYNHRLRP